MTVSLEHIYKKLSPRFPDIQKVTDSVVRFQRKASGRPFAVCYVDVSSKIPESPAALNDYQDRIVARHYFDNEKSLQWSNYLFFLVDTLPTPAARAVVERDRKYARKYVLTESELDNALSAPSFQVSDAAIRTDILATWTGILAAANIDKAILNDETLPKRLDLIEASFGQAALSKPSASSTPRQSKQPFLKQIELKAFRDHPLIRKFDLGLVTLICGPIGTGKTSLIEAIELVYCGRTKRNPAASDSYSIMANYSNGTSEAANNRRTQSLFRDRHLAWYGQSETRTNNLFQTFARFNFLNTDAAVGLAEAKDDFEEDLSKLLVGPDASKTWREIGRTAEKLEEKLKELNGIKNQVELELASHNRQIAESADLKQESGAVLAKLDGMLESIKWTREGGETLPSVKMLVESLSEFDTLLKQAIRHDWVGAPVSMSKLRQFVKDTPSRIETAEKLAKQISDSRASDRLAEQEWIRFQSSLQELRELSKLLQSGLPERLAESQRILPLIAKYQQVMVGFDDLQMQPHILFAADQTVLEFVDSGMRDSETTTKYVKDARIAYAEFNALRDESVSLGQRLREIAGKIIEKAADPDQCPLCHTRFGQGQLTSHMHEGVDQQLEKKAATLLKTIGDRENDATVATGKRAAAQWAEIACQRLELPISIKVSELMSQVSLSQKECAELLLKQARLKQEIGQLQKSGLTAERYQQLVAKMSATIQAISNDHIKAEIEKLESDAAQKLAEREGYARSIQEALSTAEMAIPIMNDSSFKTAISQLKEQLVSDESLLGKLEPFAQRFSWPEFQPFSELALSVATARQLAGDYQVTYSKEQNAVKVLATASARKQQIQKQLDGLLPRIERFSEANEVLSKIIDEHSLPGAMEEALRQNRVAIEGIFSRIHSPAEFSGLGDSLTTLVRKNGSGTASLQQISAGQRAAFALSLFLAQNAQLRSAPPLILIDDPIAHVDDLNCLSFLDYLREVVVSGDRQVVFATANDKVAMLFERKFDFLGNEDFRRYDLSR